MLNGTISVPDGEMLLEDAKDLWGMMNGLGRTYPAKRWVESLVAEDAGASLSGLR